MTKNKGLLKISDSHAIADLLQKITSDISKQFPDLSEQEVRELALSEYSTSFGGDIVQLDKRPDMTQNDLSRTYTHTRNPYRSFRSRKNSPMDRAYSKLKKLSKLNPSLTKAGLLHFLKEDTTELSDEEMTALVDMTATDTTVGSQQDTPPEEEKSYFIPSLSHRIFRYSKR